MINAHRILAIVLASIAAGCTNTPKAKPSVGPTPTTVSIQEGPLPTCNDKIISGFYDISIAAFKNGALNVDIAAYERESFAFFRSTAASIGATPEQLVEHLKGIPKQVIQIVKDDSKVLESCRNFSLALTGPP